MTKLKNSYFIRKFNISGLPPLRENQGKQNFVKTNSLQGVFRESYYTNQIQGNFREFNFRVQFQAGLVFFRKKCISSLPVEEMILSGRNREVLEEMEVLEEIGRNGIEIFY